MQDDFHNQMIGMLPKLRVQALALTRNRSAADDLVQESVVKALAARASFQPGTNFAAWMHRILRNTFVSGIRSKRQTQDLDACPAEALAIPGNAMENLVMQELSRAVARLTPDQREALLMVSMEGMSYEQVAAATGCAVGTAKCRVFRARRQLEAMLMGEERRPANAAVGRNGWNSDQTALPSGRKIGAGGRGRVLRDARSDLG